MRFSTSCGSEGSGTDSPAVRNVVEVVRKRVFRSPDFNHLPACDLRRVRAIRRTIIDCAAACPSRLVVSLPGAGSRERPALRFAHAARPAR